MIESRSLSSLSDLQPLKLIVFGLLIWSSASCAPHHPTTIIDLTYAFDDQTVYWPNNKPFQWEKIKWGKNASGHWYASGAFSASEHGGTHLDAPVHFAEQGRSVDQIPVEELIGPAIVIDVRPQVEGNPDFELQVEDVQAWETEHGQIPKESLVLLFTGWGKYWPERRHYLGSPTPEDPTTLHFPGYSSHSIQFLVSQRGIRGVGIDTASIDPGRSKNFLAHRVLNEANLYALENVAALDKLPPTGAVVTALPIKIRGGSGGPVRIFATIP